MVQICEGTKTKQDVIAQTLEEYREVYVRTRQQMLPFIAVSSCVSLESFAINDT